MASHEASEALARVGNRLRAAGYENLPSTHLGEPAWLFDLALGHPVPAEVLPARDCAALDAAAAVDLSEGHLVPRFTILATGDLLALVPCDGPDYGDRVYLGIDTLWLLQAARYLAPKGVRAAELGTGTGLVAAGLSTGYRRMVATDVLPRAAACASLTLRLNRRPPDHEALVCVADVATGLRADTFDLVVANPPWVPAPGQDEQGRTRIFDDGGPTGFEVPERFIAEGLRLLRVGGLLVVVTTDATWEDCRRPLRALCRALHRAGHRVACFPTDADVVWSDLLANVVSRTAGLVALRHVAVVVERGPHPPA